MYPGLSEPRFSEAALDSITAQNFRDFEVIVSDDTPGNELEMVCLDYKNQFPLQYVHNHTPLGSPANWNNAIRLATGKWIKHSASIFIVATFVSNYVNFSLYHFQNKII